MLVNEVENNQEINRLDLKGGLGYFVRYSDSLRATVRVSYPGIFNSCLERPSGPSSFLHKVYPDIPGGKAAGALNTHPLCLHGV